MIQEFLKTALANYDFAHLARHILICFCLFIATAAAVMLDFWSGISTAKKLGITLYSSKVRKTFDKLTGYWRFQMLAFIIGLMGTLFEWYEWPYLTLLVTLAICINEGRSMYEHSKRRKCNSAKIPEMLVDMAHWVGEENLKNSVATTVGAALQNVISKNEP